MAQKPDIYTRVTNKIIADLETGVRTWHQPWNAEHLAGPFAVAGSDDRRMNI